MWFISFQSFRELNLALLNFYIVYLYAISLTLWPKFIVSFPFLGLIFCFFFLNFLIRILKLFIFCLFSFPVRICCGIFVSSQTFNCITKVWYMIFSLSFGYCKRNAKFSCYDSEFLYLFFGSPLNCFVHFGAFYEVTIYLDLLYLPVNWPFCHYDYVCFQL